MFFQLDWFCTADRMFVFGLTLSVSALVCLSLLFAEYKKEMRKRNRKKRRWKASLFFLCLKIRFKLFKYFSAWKNFVNSFCAFYYLNNIHDSKLEFFLTFPLDFPKTENLVNALKMLCIVFLFSGIYLYSDTVKSNTGAFSALKNRRSAYVNTQA